MVLEKFCDPELFIPVKQPFAKLPTHKQRGLLLVKLTVDKLVSYSFDSVKTLQAFTSFDICAYNGESGMTGATHFEAAV